MVMVGMAADAAGGDRRLRLGPAAAGSRAAAGMHGGTHHHGGMGGPGMMWRLGRAHGPDDRPHARRPATPATRKRAQIKQIVAQAGADLKGQAAAARELRLRGMQVFTARRSTPTPPSRFACRRCSCTTR
jgi:hypothetical protein